MYRLAFESTSLYRRIGGVLGLDEIKTIMSINNALTGVFGLSMEYIVGSDIRYYLIE
jgi:hypothetical protein